MKKLIALLLSLMLVFSLAACGNNPQAAETEPATSTPVSEETQEPETSEETEAADTESTGCLLLRIWKYRECVKRNRKNPGSRFV